MQLAQLNIARMLAPIDSPVMADFVANLDRINALAEAADGFVWRLKDEDNNATSLRPFDDDLLIVNMSVWQSVAHLKAFVYQSAHVEIMMRRREWFEKHVQAFMVFWWVPDGHQPSVEEAKERLLYLQKHGESPYAFTFKKIFEPMTVRQAGMADLEALTDLFEGYRAFYQKEADREGAFSFLKTRMETSESIVYMAFEGDVAVGFTQLYPLFSSTRMKRLWLLNDLFVHPDHRGKGISKLLLERSKQLARDTDACEVMLETAKTNDIGNKLYPSVGFELNTDYNFYHFARE